MKVILVSYATNAGSTAEVAQAIPEELGTNDNQVKVHRITDVTAVNGNDAVVVGTPMIMGWHRSAFNFVKKHRQAFGQLR